MIFYIPVYVSALIVALPLSIFSRKLRRGLTARLGTSKRLKQIRTERPLYWFQFASSGEFEQCLPILDALKARSKCFILLTYFSPSAERALELETQRRKEAGSTVPWNASDYSPWDLPWVVAPLIRHLKPVAFVAIHREIWPTLLKALKKGHCKTHLFSTFWPERSQKRFGFLRPSLKLFDSIGTIDTSTENFLKSALPGTNIRCLGDSRIDRVVARKTLSKGSFREAFDPNRKNLVAASVWDEDFKAFQATLENGIPANWRLLFVPHDPRARVSERIYRDLKSRGLPVRYWYAWRQNPDSESHLIVDKVGFLAELYQTASLVFVGGSFKGRVHNVLEPAAWGCPILTGPYVWNSCEALAMGADEGGLSIASDAASFAENLKRLMNSDSKRLEMAEKAKAYIENHRGAGERYAEILVRK